MAFNPFTMGAGREKKESKELFSTSSSVKAGNHQTFVKSLLERGYKVESEEKSEETGVGGELISETVTTVLRPSNHEMPMLKFEATEKFGNYSYEEEAFKQWDEPSFEVKSFQKSAHVMRDNDPWQMIDL